MPPGARGGDSSTISHTGHVEVQSPPHPTTPLSGSAPLRGHLGVALRDSLRSGYGLHAFRADVLAAVVVGVVALPLSMALAIASGVPPQHGLYTAIVAGGVTALLGGSRVQVSGPTAAFVALLAPVSARFGTGGLLLATAMAGLLLLVMGATRMGRLVEFIPYPVVAGFTAGVAVVIATLQLRDFLGLTVAHMPDVFADRLGALLAALPTTRIPDLAVGVGTLAILLAWPRVSRKVPAPLMALAAATVAAYALAAWRPELRVATIESRFWYVVDGVRHSGIPRLPPLPVLPWRLGGPDGAPLVLSLELVRALLPSAFAIAMLGAIESLLSAVVADGMTGQRHDPDAELMAQGAGNLVAPFFGGFAATGALARTATNVRAGARSPLAAAAHSVVVLLAVLVLAPALGHLPMAALAALLLVVAWNMGEWKHFLRLMRVSPRADVLVLLTCFALTVVFDMVVSVTVGVILASLLFMRRMAEVSEVIRVPDDPGLDDPLPRGVVVFRIAGPLFFGAAQKAVDSLHSVDRRGVMVVVLDVRAVPAVDATGLLGLESFVTRLNAGGIKGVVAGIQPQPLRTLARAGWRNRKGRLRIFRSFDGALARARAAAAVPPRS
jgi:SulP family sulfate permease